MKDPERIACFHLNQLGDLLFALPALYNLRRRFPSARIVSIARPPHREPLALTGLVDDVMERPYRPLSAKLRLALRLRAQRFDLAVTFSTSQETAILAALARPLARAGFGGRRLTYSAEKVGPPSVENNLRLVKAMGCPIEKQDYVGLIKLRGEDRQRADALLKSAGLAESAEFAVLSPGASRAIKKWTDEGFGALADVLSGRFGLASVVVGTESGGPIRELSHAVVDLSGGTSLADLAAVLERAKVFIGVDSGVMHLAAAMDTPVVALFGPTDPEMTGPLGEGHRIITAGVHCSPCMKSSCENPVCMRGITAEQVAEAAATCLDART